MTSAQQRHRSATLPGLAGGDGPRLPPKGGLLGILPPRTFQQSYYLHR